MVQFSNIVTALAFATSPLLVGAASVSHLRRQSPAEFGSILDSISSLPDDAIAVVVPPNAIPNQPIQDTVVNVVDGDLTGTDVVNINTAPLPDDVPQAEGRSVEIRRRSGSSSDFFQAFAPKVAGEADSAVQGIAYLTYKLVSNATYSVNECTEFCASVDGCVFANLYYEFNNALLDWVFSEHSNLKCVLYGDVHSDLSERTNNGGQQLKPLPHPVTRIEQSSGWALPESAIPEPAVPEGYEKAFGPVNGANNAPGFMGFALLTKYDVAECARQCDARGPDPQGGRCVFFNIWRAFVNGVPKTYTCSMYFARSDESTATNHGQGALRVTWSRGYSLKSSPGSS